MPCKLQRCKPLFWPSSPQENENRKTWSSKCRATNSARRLLWAPPTSSSLLGPSSARRGQLQNSWGAAAYQQLPWWKHLVLLFVEQCHPSLHHTVSIPKVRMKNHQTQERYRSFPSNRGIPSASHNSALHLWRWRNRATPPGCSRVVSSKSLGGDMTESLQTTWHHPSSSNFLQVCVNYGICICIMYMCVCYVYIYIHVMCVCACVCVSTDGVMSYGIYI